VATGDRHSRHWRAFLEDVPWFLDPGETAEVHASIAPGAWAASDGMQESFPALCELLRAAELTYLTVKSAPHVLFTWDAEASPRSWLCRAPSSDPPPNIYPAHATLLRSFGGIVDRANEPEDTWLLNNNEVLTEREASYDSSFIEHYAWAFEETPGHIPIVTGDYYSIAREANGNDTLCHRRDRTVLLFAPDHSFDHVAPLAGCPDYTPYTREGASRFTEWVEVVARQWSSALERAP
jgi:hypothetical protein